MLDNIGLAGIRDFQFENATILLAVFFRQLRRLPVKHCIFKNENLYWQQVQCVRP